jgi:hypothetical protein
LGTPEFRVWLSDLLSETERVSSQAYFELDIFFTGRPDDGDYPPLSEIFAHRGTVVVVSFLLDILASNTDIAKGGALSLIYDITANIKYGWNEVGAHMIHALEAYKLIADSRDLISSFTAHSHRYTQELAKETLDWINWMPE